MEQKQLDDIEDSFFGEEFIDDDINDVKVKKENKAKKIENKVSTKKIIKSKKTTTPVKTAMNKVDKVTSEDKMVTTKEESLEEKDFDNLDDDLDSNLEKNKDKPEIKIESAKEEKNAKTNIKTEVIEEKKEPESRPVVDPWEDEEENEGGIFKEAFTWKLLTGILVILLVASMFTNGFGFSGYSTADALTLTQAEQKALDYVNGNLLQPPFVAELESSEDVGSLYKVSLSVAGQVVDSYLTKDGKLFFPQGFEVESAIDLATNEEKLDVSIDDDAIKGNLDAPVTIVEFSDYECPYCGRYVQETYPLIVEKYVNTGKVRYVFRDFPLSIHASAEKAAEAAECAGEQDKYWQMHDQLFAHQENLDVASLKIYAEKIGLNMEEFNACLDSGVMAAEIEADLQDGQMYGISGTPAFFINGQLISGALPFSAFEQEIETALSDVANEENSPANQDLEKVEVSESIDDVEDVPVEEIVVEDVPNNVPEISPEEKEFTINAKKWLFNPDLLRVNKGDIVVLKIIPENIDFTFAIAGLNVEESISGEKTIQFVADKVGSFEFTCSSCENWRGMVGTLIVE